MPLGILACWAACSFLGLSTGTTTIATIEICLPFLRALPSLPADQVQDFIRWKIKSKVLSPEICGYILYSELNSTRFLSGLCLPGQVPLLISLLSSYQASNCYFKGKGNASARRRATGEPEFSVLFCFKSPSFPPVMWEGNPECLWFGSGETVVARHLQEAGISGEVPSNRSLASPTMRMPPELGLWGSPNSLLLKSFL